MTHYGKLVASVIPVFNSLGDDISRQLYSTKDQTYENAITILVGLRKFESGKWIGDKTWDGLPADILEWGGLDANQPWEEVDNPASYSKNAESVWIKKGTKLSIAEVKLMDVWDKRKKKKVPHKGRSANIQRNVGCRMAIRLGAEIIALSDSKIVRPPTYIEQALDLMNNRDVEFVGGQVKALIEGGDNWINVLDDPRRGMYIQRFPNFKNGYILDRKKSGKVRTLIVFASAVFTVEMYIFVMEEVDERALISYEDFMSLVRYLKNKGIAWVSGDSKFEVLHNHRKSWKKKREEWSRSGAGAADTLHYYPSEPFPLLRMYDVMKFLGAIVAVLGAFAWPLLAANPVIFTTMIVFSAMLFVVIGIVSAERAKVWYGFFFPTITAILISLFTWNFIRQYLLRDGAQRLFQSMWHVLLYLLVRSVR